MNGLCERLLVATGAGRLAPAQVARWRPTLTYRNVRVRRIAPKRAEVHR
jgi:hypothetical protein